MNTITIISLGPGPREQLTLGALQTLNKARRVILRTGETDAAKYLAEQGIVFETLDNLHEESEDFDSFVEAAVAYVGKAAVRNRVVYAVLDALNDETAAALLRSWPEQVRLAGGTDLAAPLLQAVGAQLPVRVAAATELTIASTQDAILVTELNTRLLAGEVKLKLASWYGDDAEICFFPPSRKSERIYIRIPLCEMDRQPHYDHTTAVYLPALSLEQRERFDLWDLCRVLRRLRGEGGCPWDREQTHESLSRYLIEEAYETSEAVASQEWDHVAEELGDVLLQVLFQADIGAQYGTFELSDVTTAICKKMIARHPHVFGSEHCDTADEVADSWEKRKQRQRGNGTASAMLGDVSAGLPALLRAEKVMKKAEALGLDMNALLAEEPLAPILRMVQEMHHAGECAEEKLHLATEKMVKRVKNAENEAKKGGKLAESLTNSEINVYLRRNK